MEEPPLDVGLRYVLEPVVVWNAVADSFVDNRRSIELLANEQMH